MEIVILKFGASGRAVSGTVPVVTLKHQPVQVVAKRTDAS